MSPERGIFRPPPRSHLGETHANVARQLQCLSFQVIFRFHAFVYRVEVKNCIFLEYVQKRREADDEFEFTKYIVQEITLFFNFLKRVCMK